MSLTVKMMMRRLRGRKLSVTLSSLITAWALAMMVAGLYSSEVMDASASAYLEDNGMPDLLVSLYEHRPAEEVNEALKALPVQAYDLRLREVGQLMVNGTYTQATIVGMADQAREDISRLTVVEGRLGSSPLEAVAIAGGRDLGDSALLVINGTSLQVSITGVVRSPEHLLNELPTGGIVPGSGGETIIIVPLETLAPVSGGGINEISLMLEDAPREEVAASLASLPVSSMIFKEDHPSWVFASMGADKMSVMLPSISVVFVLIGAVSIFITMFRLVVSDSRNIGVLMSLGMRRGQIASSYLGLGAFTLLIGVPLGCILGYGFTVTIASLALEMMGGMPMVLPIAPLPFIAGSLLAALVVMAAALVPIALVLRQDIRAALSYVPRSRIWAWKGSAGSLSATLGMRNLLREPRRAAVVMMAIALAVGAAGSWLVMLDSSVTYIDEQSSAEHWDASITFNSPQDMTLAVSRFSDEQVERVMPVITLSGLASSDERSAGAVMIASPDMERLRSYDLRSGTLDLSGAVVAKKLADALAAGPGSTVTLAFGGRSLNLTITGVVNDLQTNAVYTSNQQALSVMGDGLCQGVYLTLRSGATVSSLISSVSADPWVAAVESREDVTGSTRDLFASAISLFYGYFALNLLIALAVATSAVVVSTSERDLEFTAVSSLGLPRTFVVKSLLAEVGALGLISSLLAVPMAFLLAQGFAALMEEAVFFIPVGLTTASALAVLLVGWLFTWPSVIWPIRWSRRIDIGRTLRERLQ